MGQVVFTRIFGGMGQWGGAAIALDQSGNIYVAGRAGSGELLLSNALATSPSGAFIIKLSAEASTVFYSTYFPGVATITAIATDAGGICISLDSPRPQLFPRRRACQTTRS